MRVLFFYLLVALIGCSSNPKSSTAPKPKTSAAVITPDFKPTGKIVMFNDQARFAVVNFAFGAMPKADDHLAVYRKGLKVGDLRATAQQKDNNVIADLMAGSAQKGDEVREE
jgi:hypothetical protein